VTGGGLSWPVVSLRPHIKNLQAVS